MSRKMLDPHQFIMVLGVLQPAAELFYKKDKTREDEGRLKMLISGSEMLHPRLHQSMMAGIHEMDPAKGGNTKERTFRVAYALLWGEAPPPEFKPDPNMSKAELAEYITACGENITEAPAPTAEQERQASAKASDVITKMMKKD